MTEAPRRPQRMASLALIVLMATALPWGTVAGTGSAAGTGPVESSAFDTAKLAIAALGLGLAFTVRTPGVKLPTACRLLVLYAIVALLGALLMGKADIQPDVFRSVRYAATVVATVWVVRRLGHERALRLVLLFAAVQSTAAIVARAVGLRPEVDGRLSGYLPLLHPNALAIVAGVGISATLVRYMQRATTRLDVVAFLPLIATLTLTGSRTSQFAVAAAVVIAVLARPQRAVPLAYFATMLVIFTLGLDALTGGNTFGALATRGGDASIDTTFTGRTDSWAQALLINDTLAQKMFGQGLTVKTVIVPDAAVPIRAVDGTWHSAYMEAGVVGLLLLLIALVLISAGCAGRARSFAPLLTMLVVLSVMESQFNDLTFGMLVLTLIAASIPPTTRQRSSQPARRVSVPTRTR